MLAMAGHIIRCCLGVRLIHIFILKQSRHSNANCLVRPTQTDFGSGGWPRPARQSRNQRNMASKVARASRPCVSVTGDNLAGTHRRDACATTLPVKSSPNATISGDSAAKYFPVFPAPWRLCVLALNSGSRPKRQRAGALHNASRGSVVIGIRASILDCGG